MLGTIIWDDEHATNEQVGIGVVFQDRDQMVRNRMVSIQDRETQRVYLGRIAEGPFFPRMDSRQDGDSPRVFGRIEIQGELKGTKTGDTSSRPAPGSPVHLLQDHEVGTLIGSSGNMVLGKVVGHDLVPLCLESQDKAVLPRNLGIFGTVGSGKSNTCQVVIEEAARAGWAIIVIDVEGEYTQMDAANEDPRAVEMLAELGRKPEGLKDLVVYHPASSPGERKDGKPFTLRISDFSGPVIAELLEATAPERNALFESIDHFHSRNRTRLAINEQEELVRLLEISPENKMPYTLFGLRERCSERSSKSTPDLDFVGLGTKLMRLVHSQAFDEPSMPPLNVKELLKPERVSVLDVSSASEVLQNLITADVLRKTFACKMTQPDAPPTLLVIEEAHAFISKDRIASLNATLDMLKTVTRRGRKRWFSVAFVSQQPGHLPQEVFELCNTRLVHNLRSTHNLETLMSTAGDVSQSLWGRCPLLAPGEALVSSAQLRRPLIAQIRPAASQRRFTK